LGFDHFGSARYAKEVLVAQMTSAILCAHTGTGTAEEFRNSASYISSWLRPSTTTTNSWSQPQPRYSGHPTW